MHRCINARAFAVQILLLTVLVAVNLRTNSAAVIIAWVTGTLLLSTAINVIITCARRGPDDPVRR